MPSTPLENFGFGVVAVAALVIVPLTLIWWVTAQVRNERRMRERTAAPVGRWNALRFGPLAPLLTLVVFAGAITPSLVPSLRFAFGSVGFALIGLTATSLVAFMMSIVLWAYANDPNPDPDVTSPSRG